MVRYRAWWWLDDGGVIEVGIDGESPDAVKQFLRENFRGRGYLKIYEWGPGNDWYLRACFIAKRQANMA